jgi:mono/diheme cytochrome c family protein
MKYFFLIFAFLCVAAVSIAGFRGDFSKRTPIELWPDMNRQPKVKYQAPSQFFADGRGARMPVTGTIAEEMPKELDYLHTGRMGGFWGDGIPVPVTSELIQRGQQRYAINCQVCHGAAGAGNGIVGQYGLVGIANYHDKRLREMPDGEIFHTITNGKASMYSYGDKITAEDRWAIISYIRALQRSQYATINDVPETERGNLK